MKTFERRRGFFFPTSILLLCHLSAAAVGAPLGATVSAPFLIGNFNDRMEAPDLDRRGLVSFGDERVAVLGGQRRWLTDGTAAGTEPLCEGPADGAAECPPAGA